MKTLLTLVLGGFLALSSVAQTTSTVNIIFRGINNGTNNYQVMIDGTSYFSNTNTENALNYKVTIKNLALGTHALKVYRLKNNNPAYNNRAQTFVYSKNFELSQGYDMNISILKTGQVQFTEVPVPLDQAVVKTPMASYQFNQLVLSVQNKTSQSLRSQAVRDAFTNTNNYFTTTQVRQLLSYVPSENDKLYLVKLSYAGVTDPANFIQLADLFNSTAYRNEFNYYVSTNGGLNTTKTQMTTTAFNQVLQNVKDKWSQALKAEAVRDAFINTNNYFSTAQIRQLLILINSESDRLTLAKLSYKGVTDAANFIQLADLFNSTAYRNEFNNYVSTNGGVITPTNTQMTTYAFNQLLQSVKDKWSQALKAEAVRDAFVNTNNYFSTTQIRQLLTLVTSESDRFDLVKMSYRSVTDPANFVQLADMFNSISYRNEFNNYVIANGGVTNTTKTQMTTYAFNQLLQSVKDKWSQALKAETERDAFINTNNYFSTDQIRQLLTLITSESDRLDLAKLSYRSVTDPAYFAQLSELFSSATNKAEFNNYVSANGNGAVTVVAKTPMIDSDFSVLMLSVRANLLQILKVSAERDVFSNPNNYFTSIQVKQLISLINSETNRLELAKLSYRTVTDRENFTQVYDLFQVQANKDALAAYVKANQNASL